MMLSSKINGIKVFGMASATPKNYINSDSATFGYFQSYEEQTTSDLGFIAAKRLLEDFEIDTEDIGYLVFGSKTPDYRSPTSAAVLQSRLKIGIDCICYDVNIGSNGFIHMIQLGASILGSINKKFGLIIIGDTPSKLRKGSEDNPYLISDASTAILLKKEENDNCELSFYNKSIGRSYESLILRAGGFRDLDFENPFDATNTKNFVVFENLNKIKQEFRNALSDFPLLLTPTNQVFIHSNLLNCLEVGDYYALQRTILADSSELPILLSKITTDLNKPLAFWSGGEGIAIYGMELNHLPKCLPTISTNDVFLDYKVSHQM
ncbi:MAG: hypothetical protein K9H61_02965 [Bacteroidia bacterium]|nr:hypothetical protein [Bacteroidia bacterium]MCF8445933.1 hypothetical protein [Bacteroidia bacterium]